MAKRQPNRPAIASETSSIGKSETCWWRTRPTLIGNIYDAALDPALWINVLDKTARTTGQLFAEIEEPVAVVDFMPYDEFE